VVGEPGCGAEPERCRGLGGLVVADLDVGETGVVVDGDVEVLVADPTPGAARRVVRAGLRVLVTEHAPPAPVAQPPELLHIDVHQLAWPFAFVTAHRLARRPVQPSQRRLTSAVQHPVHRRGVHAHDPGDPRRPEPPRPAQPQHLGLDRRCGPSRARPRP
jgi:hypothetical protein